jgi:hypothetical protein
VPRSQAYRRRNYDDDYDQGLGCATCGTFIVVMIVIGGVLCYVLLKVYGWI